MVVTARKPDALAEAVEPLGGPEMAVAVAGNAGDAEHRAEAVRTAVETFGSLDMLVGNVGINPVFGPLMDLDLDAFRKILDTNVVSTLGLVQEAWRAWMAEHGGSVLIVASVAGLKSSEGIAAYGVSKAALINLTTQLAVELGPTVRVNAVAPAVVKTRFAEALFDRPRGRGGRAATRSAGWACRRTSARPRPTCSATAPAGSPARPWCSTAARCPAAALTRTPLTSLAAAARGRGRRRARRRRGSDGAAARRAAGCPVLGQDLLEPGVPGRRRLRGAVRRLRLARTGGPSR